MNVRLDSLIEGAGRAQGVVAVIDVFRAFTTAAVALANGAEKILMVAEVEEALQMREAGLGQVCVGEVAGRPPAEFDFGNSPFEVASADLTGRTVIQRTSAGTQGIVLAAGAAERLYAASLVTAAATARALAAGSPEVISLVAMGGDGLMRTDEDELCAMHLRNLIEGRRGDAEAVARLVRAGGEIARFHDPARPWLHPEDVELALDIARFDFAIRVRLEGGHPVGRIERPG